MSDVLVIGGSVAGLASAYAIAQLGYEVRILERDPQQPPQTLAQAQDNWRRPTVPQSLHSHAFGSLGTNLLLRRAPEIYSALLTAGARPIQLADYPSPFWTDFEPEEADQDLRMLGCRRPAFEYVLRQEVMRQPGISQLTGATVRRLTTTGNGRVNGVELEDGQTLTAEFVVDAAGRRSRVARWLADAGLPVPPTQTSSSDITYYTRFYQQLTDEPPAPLNRGFGAGGLWDHYTAVLFLGDNGTFSISIGVLPDDTALKALRLESAFTAAIRATPLLAPWLEPGESEPISPVYAMGGLDNSIRLPVDDTVAPVTGLFSVGDSVCTTNPAYGRGVSLALAHAFGLADVLEAHPDQPEASGREFATFTGELLAPWHAEAVANDRGRAMMWRATLDGTPLGPPPPGVLTFGTVAAVSAVDPQVWRRVARVMMSLAPPQTLYADPEIAARVGRALSSGEVPHLPGAPRDELVSLVSRAAEAPHEMLTEVSR
jgi:2-polyprenyl-6-methoxyphenol hydroxylase-like FAD-dependent oxidoreductase